MLLVLLATCWLRASAAASVVGSPANMWNDINPFVACLVAGGCP
jgi:hypothetical protein